MTEKLFTGTLNKNKKKGGGKDAQTVSNSSTGLAISLFDHHAYKSEQRREVIKRVSVFLKKIQNPNPLF